MDAQITAWFILMIVAALFMILGIAFESEWACKLFGHKSKACGWTETRSVVDGSLIRREATDFYCERCGKTISKKQTK